MKYNVSLYNRVGKYIRTVCPGPFTLAEACTVISKQSKHPLGYTYVETPLERYEIDGVICWMSVFQRNWWHEGYPEDFAVEPVPGAWDAQLYSLLPDEVKDRMDGCAANRTYL